MREMPASWRRSTNGGLAAATTAASRSRGTTAVFENKGRYPCTELQCIPKYLDFRNFGTHDPREDKSNRRWMDVGGILYDLVSCGHFVFIQMFSIEILWKMFSLVLLSYHIKALEVFSTRKNHVRLIGYGCHSNKNVLFLCLETQ